MKFRNVTDDALFLPALEVVVAPGDTTDDLDGDAAEGLIGQVEKWAAVGKEAKQHQHEVVADQADPTEQES